MANFADVLAAIMQLHQRYVDAVWRWDHEAVGACMTEDVEWHIAGRVVRGRANAVAFSHANQEKSKALLVTLRTPILEVGEGVASGRTYFSAQNWLKDGTAFTPSGIYYERFVLEPDGQWRIGWRLFETIYAGPPDLSGTLLPVQDFGPPPAMPPRDAQTLFSPALKGLGR